MYDKEHLLLCGWSYQFWLCISSFGKRQLKLLNFISFDDFRLGSKILESSVALQLDSMPVSLLSTSCLY